MKSVQVESEFILKVHFFSCLTVLGTVEKILLRLNIWTQTQACPKNTCEIELIHASWILVP